MKSRKKTPKLFVTLSLLSTLTVFSWIGIEIYHSFKKTTIPSLLQKDLEPLNPTLDTDTLESLSQRTHLSEAELNQVPEITLISLEEEPVATPSAEEEKNEKKIHASYYPRSPSSFSWHCRRPLLS